ncbi:PEP phosphonomutase-like protein [Sporormia fimetaria CBS 119925]|uniref:PEP phosphonomutase-like protein n=1 Tax=Sporormia fimetaria CBS 119925 TaxID=1340428 RepID=A0A6A6V159_9PLEO|nr:PEP phosphonomutase-like protein [Sporormia fimetaria CBS 119925]
MSTSHSSTSPNSRNTLALTLKSLHQPGTPLLLTNIWSALSATAIAPLPQTRAMATASAAVASSYNLTDDDLTLELNLQAVRLIAPIAQAHGKPLTVDFQDGYGDRLEEGIRELIAAGAVGCNLEDWGREVEGAEGKGGLYEIERACERIRRVLATAREMGVPDFVVNARTDALLAGCSIDEAIARGKAYLDAGAHNVFIWGGSKRGGMSGEEVKKAVEGLDGQLNVSLKLGVEGALSVKELGEMGVARISVGPRLLMRAMEMVSEEVRRLHTEVGV